MSNAATRSRSSLRARLSIAGVLLLAACGEATTADILKKAEKIESRAELERALGKPAEISKLGPIETWTYKASNGTVSFLITGDKVQLTTAGTKSP